METIGNRIKSKRKKLKMTQLELAQMLNVTDRAVSKWEQNQGNPDISILPKIAEIFNVSLDYQRKFADLHDISAQLIYLQRGVYSSNPANYNSSLGELNQGMGVTISPKVSDSGSSRPMRLVILFRTRTFLPL